MLVPSCKITRGLNDAYLYVIDIDNAKSDSA